MWIEFLNPFPVIGLFLHPLKKFSDVFRGYSKRLVAWVKQFWRNFSDEFISTGVFTSTI